MVVREDFEGVRVRVRRALVRVFEVGHTRNDLKSKAVFEHVIACSITLRP